MTSRSKSGRGFGEGVFHSISLGLAGLSVKPHEFFVGDSPEALAALPFRIHSYAAKRKAIPRAKAAKGTRSCRRPIDFSSEDMVDADCYFPVIVDGNKRI